MVSPEPWNATRAAAIVAGLQSLEGATLPILHALQEAFGYVDAQAVPMIADALNLSRAEVHGCLTFYHDFRREPPAGRHHVKLCRAEACQAMGSDRLHGEILSRMGCDWHGTSADGVSVEPVYCLGLCANAPAALVDDEPLARLSAESLDAALKEARA